MIRSIFFKLFIFIIITVITGCGGAAFLNMDNSVHPILFKYEGQAQSVCLAGDFNKWSLNIHCLQKNNGLWSIRLMLPAGIYRYAFIINGQRWEVDQKALFIETDGFGRQNAVVIIN